MAQSLNTKVDLTIKGNSFQGLNEYGNIMIGDRAFEFYNQRDVNKFIQIPWEEIDYVIASVYFKGRYIPRYAIRTKKNGTYTFASKKPKTVLRAMNKYVDSNHLVRSLTFFDVVKRNIKSIFKTKNK